tara:strand:+ start:1526 stop:2344 length:819 start_codon:yes stop_codon:yes gene_type:complete
MKEKTMNAHTIKSIFTRAYTGIFSIIAILLFTDYSLTTKALSGTVFILLTSVFFITDFAHHNVKFRKIKTCAITLIFFGYAYLISNAKNIMEYFFSEAPDFNTFISVYGITLFILTVIFSYYIYNVKKEGKHPIRQYFYLVLPVISLIAFVYTRLTNFADNSILFLLFAGEPPAVILYANGVLPALFPFAFISIVSLLLIKNKPKLLTYISQIVAIAFMVCIFMSLNAPIDAIYTQLSYAGIICITILSIILCLDLKNCYFTKIKTYLLNNK